MKTAKILKIIGLLPICFMALVYLVFGIGESSGGDWGGLMHLVQFHRVGDLAVLETPALGRHSSLGIGNVSDSCPRSRTVSASPRFNMEFLAFLIDHNTGDIGRVVPPCWSVGT
jgi:hypothetical protein